MTEKPVPTLSQRALVSGHSGGAIVGVGGAVLTAADAEALRGLHLDEARAATAAGDHRASGRSARLALELARASEARARWRRASGPVRGGVGSGEIIFP